ncbi:hypothetical protein Tco_0424649 [Tanacetum coccineum]
MGISVNSRPIETGIKDFLSGVVGTMMSLGGSIMASHEDINGFLALNFDLNLFDPTFDHNHASQTTTVLGIKHFRVSIAKLTVSTARRKSSYCSRLQLPVLNQSVNTARITVVGEKVNAAESLLVVSTEVNAD